MPTTPESESLFRLLATGLLTTGDTWGLITITRLYQGFSNASQEVRVDALALTDALAKTGNDIDGLIREIRHEVERRSHALQPGIEGPPGEVELLIKALRIAGSPERLAEWIRNPIEALNGQTPYSLMQSEQGRAEVDNVLGQIEHGLY